MILKIGACESVCVICLTAGMVCHMGSGEVGMMTLQFAATQLLYVLFLDVNYVKKCL